MTLGESWTSRMPTRADKPRRPPPRAGRRWLAGVAALALVALPASGHAPGEPVESAFQLSAELRELIGRLDHADPVRRLEAERSLIGAEGFNLDASVALLRKPDWTPEQRQRLTTLAARLFYRHERAALGVQFNDINGMIHVVAPTAGFPAARVLRPGDIIEAIDGRPILADPGGQWTATRQFQVEIISRLPGEQVTLTVLRQGERLDIPCTFGRWALLNAATGPMEEIVLDAWRRRAEREGLLPALRDGPAEHARTLDASAPPGAALAPDTPWSDQPAAFIPTRLGTRAPTIAVLGSDLGWHEISTIRGRGLVQNRPGVLMPERAEARVGPRGGIAPNELAGAVELEAAVQRERLLQSLERERIGMLRQIENIAGEQERMVDLIRRGAPGEAELEARIRMLDDAILNIQARLREVETRQRELRGEPPLVEP